MNPYGTPQTRSFDSPFAAQGGGYPGVGDPFAGGGLFGPGPGAGAGFGSSPNLPAVLPNATPALGASAAPAAAKSGSSLPSLGDLKLLVERMGGLDGILATMGKVQKVFGTFQQIAPMFKLLAGSFLKKGASVAKAADGGEWRPRRRKRRGQRRRTDSGARSFRPRKRTGGARPRRKSYR